MPTSNQFLPTEKLYLGIIPTYMQICILKHFFRLRLIQFIGAYVIFVKCLIANDFVYLADVLAGL